MTTEQRVSAILRALPRPAPGKAGVLLLDGRAAAGKSTLAEALAAALGQGSGVIHTDDFFLPAALRTPRRYAEPGGNVHYERFAAEVLPRLADPAPFAYTRFDCGTMAPGDTVTVPEGGWRIVEGSYACHPRFGLYGDLRVFCDVDPAEQLRRIAARNGAEMARVFAERWIPLEEAYFAAYAVKEQADLVL